MDLREILKDTEVEPVWLARSTVHSSTYDIFQDELAHSAHEHSIISIESSKDCKLIATSAEHGPPTGCVWRVVESPVENGLFSLENA